MKPSYKEVVNHLFYVTTILERLIAPHSNTHHEEAKALAPGTLKDAKEVLGRARKH